MTPRWKVVVTYRSENGPVDVTHEIEELEDLHNLVEAGPDWNAIEDIRITLAKPAYQGFTIEEGEFVGQLTGLEWDAWDVARRGRA